MFKNSSEKAGLIRFFVLLFGDRFLVADWEAVPLLAYGSKWQSGGLLTIRNLGTLPAFVIHREAVKKWVRNDFGQRMDWWRLCLHGSILEKSGNENKAEQFSLVYLVNPVYGRFPVFSQN